ncbi:hypothetical protein BC937DRAFT_86338 [Endogone sp. FLAS-F59071]|nr:hypothetical protein BC937DRAFT_86338 [Endogone sp. FLAS-F59071]|eukprot:RUS20106.1 hypothetical protein BC937DRAFT_86338 [Endogone sp. FLAS-F59071]
MQTQYGLIYSDVESNELTVPLKKVYAKVQINISQTFTNETNSVLEAVYKFPLPESAAVKVFEVELADGRKVLGKVEAKKKALKTYKHALELGDGAFLLEENTPESKLSPTQYYSPVITESNKLTFVHPTPKVFQLKVGNLGRGETLTVHLHYVQELPNDMSADNLIRFSLPMTIAPRYHPVGAPARVNMNVVYSEAARGYTLSLDVTCMMKGRISGITSPTHKIVTNLEGESKVANVLLAEGYTYLDKDFVLLIEAEDSDNPRAFVEYNKETDTHCVMLTMVPRFSLAEVQSELIFIVDRSGSMTGPKIEKTAEALSLFLRSLPRDCYFNVISFGSTFSPLFKDSSEAYNAETLSKAIVLSRHLDASMRGTEILSPLEWAFEHARDDMPTTVLLLTDGQVSNNDEVIELTRRYVHGDKRSEKTRLRVFTLGIGNSVSHHLVNALARVGRGYSQYVGEMEGLESKVVQMLKNALQPPVSDYMIRWAQEEKVRPLSASLASEKTAVKKVLSFFNANMRINQHPTSEAAVPNIRQTPQLIPTILPHTRLIVYCFVAPGWKPYKTLLLKGQSNDGLIEISVDVEKAAQGSLIHTLAARKMITELQEGTSYLHINNLGDDLFPSKNTVRTEIITMGTQFSVASPHTSFVAVDQRSDGREGRLEQHVRVEVPSADDDISYLADNMSKTTKNFDSGNMSKAMKDFDSGNFAEKLGKKLGSLGRRKGHLTLSIDAPLRHESVRASVGNASKSARASANIAPISHEDSEFEEDESDDGDVKMLREPSSSEKEKSLATSPHLTGSKIHDLHKLVEFQSYDGCFVLTDELAGFFGFENKEAFLSKTRSMHPQVIRDENAWTTLYVIAYLNKNLAEFKDGWELVANKALKWVGELITGGLKSAKELIEEIRVIVPKR